jgi:hypothetical protein
MYSPIHKYQHLVSAIYPELLYQFKCGFQHIVRNIVGHTIAKRLIPDSPVPVSRIPISPFQWQEFFARNFIAPIKTCLIFIAHCSW